MKDYIKINKSLWNRKTDIHIHSEFYDVAGFLAGKSSLKDIELALLGDIKGKSILHLQCHFGQDTLSLARMGARVTGIDLSDRAIDKAKDLAEQLNLEEQTKFICCDLFELEKHLDDTFDIIFTSYGTIDWFPKLDPWGAIIARYLQPEGQFIFVEFHPMVWMLDEEFQKIEYSYFNIKTFQETYTNSYTDGGMHQETPGLTWNHPISDIFRALRDNGLIIEDFQEYAVSPYPCFPNLVESKNGYQIKGFEGKLPMVYSVIARRETSSFYSNRGRIS